MLSAISTEILLILLLILINGVLAMSEIALVSVRKTRLRERANRGDARAAAALGLADSPTRFLSTIQIGITLIGILAGAFGGATIAEYLEERLASVPFIAPYAGGVALGIVVLIITYLALVFGEIVPKRVGLTHPEVIAQLVARPISLLATATRPLVAVLSVSTEAVLFVMRVRPTESARLTDTDIKLLLEQGAQEGVLAQEEQAMAQRTLELGDRRVAELMTPRPRLAWIDVEAPAEVMWREIAESPHAYLLVCRRNLDSLLGVVSARELWAQYVDGREPDVLQAAVQPTFVPEVMPAFSIMKLFSGPGPRVAVVVDELGSIQGVITPTDIFEEIAGQVAGRLTTVAKPTRREDGSWLVDGLSPMHEVMELLEIDEPPEGERQGYQTLGGLVMRRLGRVPEVGDGFEWAGYKLEVAAMDARRVDKVTIKTL